MATFNNLGIKRIERRFTGVKVSSLDEIVGKDIKILDFEICPSKKKQNDTYLKMQVLLDGKKRFLSTGGKFLKRVLAQVDREMLKSDPIETVILKTKGYFYFEGTMVGDDEVCEGEEIDKMN